MTEECKKSFDQWTKDTLIQIEDDDGGNPEELTLVEFVKKYPKAYNNMLFQWEAAFNAGYDVGFNDGLNGEVPVPELPESNSGDDDLLF